MKVLALVIVAACVPQPLGRTDLHAQRDRAYGHRVASGVGLAIGVAAAVAGGFLLAHATDIRSRESSADTEAGLGTLVGGTMLLVGGSAVTIGSGLVLAVSSHQHTAITRRIQRLESSK